jgi:DNA sulfur modification protein DndD
VVSKIEEFFEEKISGGPKKQENIIGLSQKDSDKILDEFDRIREDLPKRMESLSKEFNQITEKLQKIKTSLDNAPADSVFGPILEKIRIEYDKISTIKSEARRIEDKIQIKKGEISIKRIEGRKEVASKHDAYDVDTNIELTKKVQNALDEYAIKLKGKKIHLLENYILESLKIILHKEDFIHKVSIDKETFEITLYDKNKDVIRRDELSEGEKQLFATSILWSLAKTSGRSLPFIIDTPLARLDVDHRDNLVEEFFPAASHQVIILSTDTEITKSYYEKLLPYITRSYSMEYDSEMRCSKIADHYFEFKEEETIAV